MKDIGGEGVAGVQSDTGTIRDAYMAKESENTSTVL
jgi:hypothetical protein